MKLRIILLAIITLIPAIVFSQAKNITRQKKQTTTVTTKRSTTPTPKTPEEMYQRGLAAYSNYNFTEAAKWFRKAAEQEHPAAQRCMGEFYEWGKGVPQNDSIALEWFRRSAENGNDHAQWKMGAMYEVGEVVEQDLDEALKWFEKSAAQGNDLGRYGVERIKNKKNKK